MNNDFDIKRFDDLFGWSIALVLQFDVGVRNFEAVVNLLNESINCMGNENCDEAVEISVWYIIRKFYGPFFLLLFNQVC